MPQCLINIFQLKNLQSINFKWDNIFYMKNFQFFGKNQEKKYL